MRAKEGMSVFVGVGDIFFWLVVAGGVDVWMDVVWWG